MLSRGSQHVGDDPHTPHVCLVGDLVVIHHLRRQELWGPKVHLQLLVGVIPGGETKCSEHSPLPGTLDLSLALCPPQRLALASPPGGTSVPGRSQ